ncbi:hypothetical protein, partial [Acinetobacter sp.]
NQYYNDRFTNPKNITMMHHIIIGLAYPLLITYNYANAVKTRKFISQKAPKNLGASLFFE